jgi:sporulation protein YlmC with PRC-barrel domain
MTGVGDAPRRRLELGESIICADGAFGKLQDVVVDPRSRRVTHIVAAPHHRPGQARLVPIEFVVAERFETGIELSCTVEEAHRLEPIGELSYMPVGQVPIDDPEWDVGITEAVLTPNYDPGALVDYTPGIDPGTVLTYDRIPKGEAEIRRLSDVTSADDHHVGQVEAIVIDGDKITHVVVRHGHLWGKRETAIPIDAIDVVETDHVQLKVSKKKIEALPSHHLRRALDD